MDRSTDAASEHVDVDLASKSRLARIWHAPSLAMVALAGVFLLLASVVIVGSALINSRVGATQRGVLLNRLYQHAASGVSAEESLERKYRLEPSPVARADHDAAEARVEQAILGVRTSGTAQDRQLMTQVAAEHAKYVLGADKLFAAVDSDQSTAQVSAIDSASVDPIFGVMQTQIYAAAARHEADALSEVASARRTSIIVLLFDIATLLAGLGVIALSGLALVRSQRRLRGERDANRHLAFHDDLTGLPNRALFQDRINQAIVASQRSGAQVAVLFADLNRFKDVNDTLGHHYGDLLLIQVAERFVTTLRAEDSVARLGGDEFAVLLAVSSRDEAVAAAQRLPVVLEQPFNTKDIMLEVDASIGIALTGAATDVETLLRHADVAMYEAKSEHKPFSVYEITRDDNTVVRLALLGDLRRGISRGELVLYYQPKVSAATGELHGVEALVRWNHPTRGLLAPDSFIPIAEGTAVIHPLTEEVLRQALRQMRSWLDRGWTIPVAVNISARSLHDLDFPVDVRRHLDEAGVPSTLLSLELTESSIMTDPDRALTVLDALAAMGIGLSIDDFGTGYSSMSYLKKLPVRELKIDRSFVSGLTTEANDVVLVQSAVDLGHNLGLQVVAEGVEDDATQRLLASMGCDEMQGYHISRPAPAARLESWLERHQPKPARHAAPPCADEVVTNTH